MRILAVLLVALCLRASDAYGKHRERWNNYLNNHADGDADVDDTDEATSWEFDVDENTMADGGAADTAVTNLINAVSNGDLNAVQLLGGCWGRWKHYLKEHICDLNLELDSITDEDIAAYDQHDASSRKFMRRFWRRLFRRLRRLRSKHCPEPDTTTQAPPTTPTPTPENTACESEPCNGGTCEPVGATDFSCTSCPPLYEGPLCDIVACPCLNGGFCGFIMPPAFSCVCTAEFDGLLCEEAAESPCMSDICANGGTCTTTEVGGFTCACTSEWTGAQCNIPAV